MAARTATDETVHYRRAALGSAATSALVRVMESRPGSQQSTPRMETCRRRSLANEEQSS